MESIDFDSYLHGKKIDAAAYAKAEPEQYSSLKLIFDQVHPDSFTAQKLFLINPIRRKYPYQAAEPAAAAKPKAARPVLKPKPKTN